MAREFPIANGKLVTDLDANGHKILNAQSEGGGELPNLSDYAKKTDLEGFATREELNVVGNIAQGASDVAYTALNEVSKQHVTVEQKRDRTNNIAAKDETQFTEWKCVCDNPFVQAYIDEQPPTVSEFYPDEPGMTPWFTVIFTEGIFTIQGQAQVQCVGGDYPYDVPDGQLDHVTEMTFGRVYYVSPYVGTPEEWGESISVEVRFTRTKVFTTKSGEPYVTPTGVKTLAIPKYEFVTAEIADGVVTVKPYTSATITSDGAAFDVAVGGDVGKARDCVLVVDCTSLATSPTITWPSNFHPRTDAATDLACVAGVRNVYWITEFAQGEFCVAGWQETMGGNAS